ncbi:MAG TPA: BlaI/MecI/CopY family transcriptional regulator [Acidobacteriaceae bacterium]|nr:BlaI/MecI/CopY family transcriptional regulator [Acidobacteriaceae bacterium]
MAALLAETFRKPAETRYLLLSCIAKYAISSHHSGDFHCLRNQCKHNLKLLRCSIEANMQNKLSKAARAKRQLSVPTPAEIRLLQILWDREEATVEDVVNAHPEKERPNYKTTQTLLRIMEQKGFITHESRGRLFVFRPLVSRKTIDHLSIQTLVSRNFHGSASGLLINLLEASPIKKKQLDELEAYMREYRKRYQLGDRE